MKKITLFLFALFTSWQINAQVSIYAFSQSNGTYTAITGGTLAASGASLDDGILSVTLPAAFTYNGNSITTVGFSPNGYLIMGNTTTHGYTPLSSTATSNGVISGLGMDLVSNAASSELRWEQIGNEIIFQWKEFRRYLATPESINFQIRLNTSNGQINVVYDAPTSVVASETRIPQVGLRGTANTDYNARRLTTSVPDATPSWNDTAAATSNAHNVRFTNTAPAAFPASGLTFTWSPPVPCSGAPVAGTVTPVLQNICAGTTPANLVATGFSSGVTGLTFQWEESNDDGATDAWAPVVGGTGATTATYTPPAFSGTPIYYRLNVTCTNSTTSAQTASVLVSTPTPPSNQATAVTIPAATVNYDRAVINWTNGNGTRRVVYVSDSPIFIDPVNGNAPALVANALYSGSGQQIIFDGTGTTVTVTGLATGTQYYIKAYEYLRCGAGPFDYYYNVTTGTNIGTFTTCDIYAVPALEDFTTYVPGCWQEADNGDLVAGPATFGSSSWAADGFGNVGTTGAMRVNLDATGDNDWILSPLYTIPANYELKFDASANQWGTNPIAPTTPWEADDFVEVLVSTGTTNWTVLYTYNNTNVPSNTGTPNIIDLDSYVGQTVRFAFRGVEGLANGGADIEFIVDNFQLRETPPCVEPTTLTVSNITSSGADLSWVDPSGIQFDYELVVQLAGGGSPTVAGDIVDIDSLPLTVNTLNPNTNYEFWVRANCGVDGNSAWVGPVTFRTLCNSITSLPHSESFDAAALPSCWSTALISGSTNWAPTTNNDGVPAPRTGTRFAGKSWLGNDNALLISPVYNLSAYPTDQVRLNVWIYRNTVGLSTDRVTFYANNVNNLTGATMLLDIPLPITSAPTVAAAGWYNYAVNLPLSFNTAGDFYIIAQGRTTSSFSSYSVGFDDYVLELAPSVPNCSTVSTPANLATNVAIETNISWSANVDATGYFLRIGTTPGGSEVLVNTDLGNVLTYNPPVDFNYSTVYYVTLTPYNTNGTAVGCTETSFTTRNAPPTGSICSDPIVINPLTLPYTTTDNTNLYGDDYENGSTQCSSFYMSGDDVVYTITPPTNMSVDIVLSNLSGTYSGIHVLDGCPNSTTPPACIAFAGNSGTTIRDIQDVLLTGGVTYYIVISTWATPQSTAYTLTITQNTCVNPTVSFSATSNCPTTNFNAVANITNLGSATSLTVSDNQGSTPQVVTATGNVSFGPFAFGTNVVLTVVNDQDTSCSVTSSNLTTAACPPTNDDCATAIALTAGGVFSDYPVVGTTVSATTATGLTYACQTSRANDVWYSVVVPPSGTITIETQADGASALTDTVLSVFSGTCGTLVEVGCDDDTGVGNFSILNLTQPAGTTLYIGVWRWSSATNGTFQVSAYDASLSSGSFDNANFSAYPNPVKDVLNVSYSTEISSIRVINMIGQEVISKNINATSTQVDMSQLSAGTYIVNVTVGDNVKTLKVVKQ